MNDSPKAAGAALLLRASVAFSTLTLVTQALLGESAYALHPASRASRVQTA